LTKELPRKKVKPQIVYFSTASEPLAPFAPVLDELYKIFNLLLSNSVAVYISTKAHIPDKFIDLFSGYPGLVFAQVGITTADDHIRKIFEPGATPVKTRLNNISRLVSKGIFTEARIDPVMPGITDQDDSMRELFRALSDMGCKQAVASYLFLRNSNRRAFCRALPGLDNEVDKYFSETIDGYCGGNSIRVVSKTYRQEKYARFHEIAEKEGVGLKFCACKNPGVTENVCHPQAGTANQSQEQRTLF
jgi:DNA repair photolyase